MSLPSSVPHKFYLCHCRENKSAHVNAASFGKFVLLGLTNRRLATRGNSKHNCYGICVIPGSALNQLSDDGNSAVHQQPSSQEPYKFLSDLGGSGSGNHKMEEEFKQKTSHSTQVYVIFTVLKCNPCPPFYTVVTTLHVSAIHRHHQVRLTLTIALQLFLKCCILRL
jgi:hypothetical protein